MCENIQYWMRLYVARVIKGGLMAVVASFLLFECSDDSSKMDNPVIGKVILSENTLAFDDTAGATGGVYTISLSQDPAPDKTVQITLTSDNVALQISPAIVNFTEMTGKAPQTITVTRKSDASSWIPADITGLIDHAIASNADSDPNIRTFQDGSTVDVTVRSTAPSVIISENMLFSYDILGNTGVEYTISLNQDLALDRIVQITLTLTSENDALQISPVVVNFTAGESSQTITVTRTGDASDKVSANITGLINHTITPNAENDPNIVTFQGDSTVDVTVWSTTDTVDPDGDGLIEIYTATMLDNMRHDRAGASYKTSANGDSDSRGCPEVDSTTNSPTLRCNGYELAVDIDLLNLLDTGGVNGEIDKTTVGIDTNADGDTTDADDKQVTVIDTGTGKDRSWVPIGDGTTKFTGTFEGNGHTIANLWVNGSFKHAGLFGFTDGTVEIRNVGVISGSVHSSSSSSGVFSGGLVGSSGGSLMIVNSYFSGLGGVSSSFFSSGGLVGESGGSLMIVNSYFSGSGGVSSSSPSTSFSGGLVGDVFVNSNSSLTIMNSYFSGSGGVSSSTFSISIVPTSFSGGLVGGYSSTTNNTNLSLTIMNSYFGGSSRISSSSFSSSSSSSPVSSSGGLMGSFPSVSVAATLTITNSYWNTEAPQSVKGSPQSPKRAQGNAETNPSNTTGLTLEELQAISGTHPDGLPSGGTDNTKAWDLGTASQLPAIKKCVGSITDGVCASYGALIKGQR